MDEQRTTNNQTINYSFKPTVSGRILFFISQIFWGALINLFLMAGIAWLSKTFDNEKFIYLIAVTIVITLLIIVLRTVRSLYSFEISYDSMIATSKGKSREFSMDDNYISAETMTTYVYGIPFTSRKMVVASKNPAPKEKQTSIKLTGYNKKTFAQLMTATNKISDLHDAEKRAEMEALSPNVAPTGPVVRGIDDNGPVDSSLNRAATYAIVTKPEDIIQKTSIPLIIFLVILGGVLAVSGFLTDDIIPMGLGIFLAIIAVVMLVTRSNNKVSKNTMMGAEITPTALTISVQGDNQYFPWETIQAIQLTPLGYSGNYNRTITLSTPAGKYSYIYGLESNNKLDENYAWFTEYLKLHALDKIEYLYR